MLSKYTDSILFKSIAVVLVCLFIANDIAWAAPQDHYASRSATLAPPTQVANPEFIEKVITMESLLAEDAVDNYIREQIKKEKDIFGKDWKSRRTERVSINDPRVMGLIQNNVKYLKYVIFVKIAGLHASTGQRAHVGLRGKNYNGMPVIYIDSMLANTPDKCIQRHDVDEILQWENLRVNVLHIKTKKRMRRWITENIKEAHRMGKEFNDNSYPLGSLPKEYTYFDNYYIARALSQYGLDENDKNVNIAAHDEKSKRLCWENVAEFLSKELKIPRKDLELFPPFLQEQIVYRFRVNFVRLPKPYGKDLKEAYSEIISYIMRTILPFIDQEKLVDRRNSTWSSRTRSFGGDAEFNPSQLSAMMRFYRAIKGENMSVEINIGSIPAAHVATFFGLLYNKEFRGKRVPFKELYSKVKTGIRGQIGRHAAQFCLSKLVGAGLARKEGQYPDFVYVSTIENEGEIQTVWKGLCALKARATSKDVREVARKVGKNSKAAPAPAYSALKILPPASKPSVVSLSSVSVAAQPLHNNPLRNPDTNLFRVNEMIAYGGLYINHSREDKTNVAIKFSEENKFGVERTDKIANASRLLTYLYTELGMPDASLAEPVIRLEILRGFIEPVYMMRYAGIICIAWSALLRLDFIFLSLLMNHEIYPDEFDALYADRALWKSITAKKNLGILNGISKTGTDAFFNLVRQMQNDPYIQLLQTDCITPLDEWKLITHFIIREGLQRAERFFASDDEKSIESACYITWRACSGLLVLYPFERLRILPTFDRLSKLCSKEECLSHLKILQQIIKEPVGDLIREKYILEDVAMEAFCNSVASLGIPQSHFSPLHDPGATNGLLVQAATKDDAPPTQGIPSGNVPKNAPPRNLRMSAFKKAALQNPELPEDSIEFLLKVIFIYANDTLGNNLGNFADKVFGLRKYGYITAEQEKTISDKQEKVSEQLREVRLCNGLEDNSKVSEKKKFIRYVLSLRDKQLGLMDSLIETVANTDPRADLLRRMAVHSKNRITEFFDELETRAAKMGIKTSGVPAKSRNYLSTISYLALIAGIGLAGLDFEGSEIFKLLGAGLVIFAGMMGVFGPWKTFLHKPGKPAASAKTATGEVLQQSVVNEEWWKVKFYCFNEVVIEGKTYKFPVLIFRDRGYAWKSSQSDIGNYTQMFAALRKYNLFPPQDIVTVAASTITPSISLSDKTDERQFIDDGIFVFKLSSEPDIKESLWLLDNVIKHWIKQKNQKTIRVTLNNPTEATTLPSGAVTKIILSALILSIPVACVACAGGSFINGLVLACIVAACVSNMTENPGDKAAPVRAFREDALETLRGIVKSEATGIEKVKEIESSSVLNGALALRLIRRTDVGKVYLVKKKFKGEIHFYLLVDMPQDKRRFIVDLYSPEHIQVTDKIPYINPVVIAEEDADKFGDLYRGYASCTKEDVEHIGALIRTDVSPLVALSLPAVTASADAAPAEEKSSTVVNSAVGQGEKQEEPALTTEEDSPEAKKAFNLAGLLVEDEDILIVRLMQKIGIREGQSVLSIGPGVDIAHLLYAAIKGARVDVNQPEYYITPATRQKQPHLEYLENALKIVKDSAVNNISPRAFPLPIQQANIPSNPGYDLVVLVGVLDGIDGHEAREIAREAVRVVKDGGIIIFGVLKKHEFLSNLALLQGAALVLEAMPERLALDEEKGLVALRIHKNIVKKSELANSKTETVYNPIGKVSPAEPAPTPTANAVGLPMSQNSSFLPATAKDSEAQVQSHMPTNLYATDSEEVVFSTPKFRPEEINTLQDEQITFRQRMTWRDFLTYLTLRQREWGPVYLALDENFRHAVEDLTDNTVQAIHRNRERGNKPFDLEFALYRTSVGEIVIKFTLKQEKCAAHNWKTIKTNIPGFEKQGWEYFVNLAQRRKDRSLIRAGIGLYHVGCLMSEKPALLRFVRSKCAPYSMITELYVKQSPALGRPVRGDSDRSSNKPRKGPSVHSVARLKIGKTEASNSAISEPEAVSGSMGKTSSAEPVTAPAARAEENREDLIRQAVDNYVHIVQAYHNHGKLVFQTPVEHIYGNPFWHIFCRTLTSGMEFEDSICSGKTNDALKDIRIFRQTLEEYSNKSNLPELKRMAHINAEQVINRWAKHGFAAEQYEAAVMQIYAKDSAVSNAGFQWMEEHKCGATTEEFLAIGITRGFFDGNLMTRLQDFLKEVDQYYPQLEVELEKLGQLDELVKEKEPNAPAPAVRAEEKSRAVDSSTVVRKAESTTSGEKKDVVGEKLPGVLGVTGDSEQSNKKNKDNRPDQKDIDSAHNQPPSLLSNVATTNVETNKTNPAVNMPAWKDEAETNCPITNAANTSLPTSYRALANSERCDLPKVNIDPSLSQSGSPVKETIPAPAPAAGAEEKSSAVDSSAVGQGENIELCSVSKPYSSKEILTKFAELRKEIDRAISENRLGDIEKLFTEGVEILHSLSKEDNLYLAEGLCALASQTYKIKRLKTRADMLIREAVGLCKRRNKKVSANRSMIDDVFIIRTIKQLARVEELISSALELIDLIVDDGQKSLAYEVIVGEIPAKDKKKIQSLFASAIAAALKTKGILVPTKFVYIASAMAAKGFTTDAVNILENVLNETAKVKGDLFESFSEKQNKIVLLNRLTGVLLEIKAPIELAHRSLCLAESIALSIEDNKAEIEAYGYDKNFIMADTLQSVVNLRYNVCNCEELSVEIERILRKSFEFSKKVKMSQFKRELCGSALILLNNNQKLKHVAVELLDAIEDPELQHILSSFIITAKTVPGSIGEVSSAEPAPAPAAGAGEKSSAVDSSTVGQGGKQGEKIETSTTLGQSPSLDFARDFLWSSGTVPSSSAAEQIKSQNAADIKNAVDVFNKLTSKREVKVEPRYYKVKYNKTKLLEGITDAANSPEKVIKTYTDYLGLRLPENSIKLDPNGGKDGLICVECYNDPAMSESSLIGKGSIDIEEDISGKPLRIVGMLNIAFLASQVTKGVLPEEYKSLIQKQCKDILDEKISDDRIVYDSKSGIHIMLPHAGQIPLQITLEEYYRLTIEQLSQSV